MKTNLFLLIAFIVSAQVFAEMSLVVTPLSGQEQVNALAKIGYVHVQHDSMFIYSKTDNVLLWKNRLLNVRKVTYEERETLPTLLDEPQEATSIRIYPTLTQDALVVENVTCDVVRVINLNGQVVMTEPVINGNKILNVASLPMGTYLLQLNTECFKFVKQ